MMMMRTAAPAAMVLLILSAPLAPAQPAPPAQPLPSPTAPPDGAAKTRLTDASFVEQAALGGMTEIALSKLAIKQSGNAKVRQFAETMVKDHESTNVKLKQVALKNRLALPQALRPEQQQKIAGLQALSGERFTAAYVNLMKQDHDTTVGLFDQAAGEPALSRDFRDFAQQALPVLRLHQQHAHALTETDDSRMPTQSKTAEGMLRP